MEELKHYKKLCLEMRKKNTELNHELNECKDNNKKSLSELQRKVDKLSIKFQQKKENEQDGDKV